MNAPDERVWAGVEVLLDNYAKVTAGDTVLVAYTPESRGPAAWIATALKLRKIPVTTLAMNAMADETFQSRLEAALPSPESLTSGKLVIITAERDTMSHTGVFRYVLPRYDRNKWAALRIISASEEFFIHTMKARSEELSALNTALFEKMFTARKLRITTSSGTDLRVTLDSEKYRWISNRGVWKPGSFMILPAGEVATYPASIEGVLVADGAFNVNVFTNLDARLQPHPIKVHIKDSKAADFECANPQMVKLLELVFARPGARNVGEVGFGTNKGVEEFISMNSHINERRPGVHLGFGQHNQSIYVGHYDCDVHMDMIATDGMVWVDDSPTPINLRELAPSSGEHPKLVMDEDIDGDCCGLWLDPEMQACPIGITATPEQLQTQKRLDAHLGRRRFGY